MLSAAVLASNEGDVDGGLVIFSARLYRVVRLVVDNIDQCHVISDCRMNHTTSCVRNVVDDFGSKVDEPNDPESV